MVSLSAVPGTKTSADHASVYQGLFPFFLFRIKNGFGQTAQFQLLFFVDVYKKSSCKVKKVYICAQI